MRGVCAVIVKNTDIDHLKKRIMGRKTKRMDEVTVC
jgi:hypothetical protein